MWNVNAIHDNSELPVDVFILHCSVIWNRMPFNTHSIILVHTFLDIAAGEREAEVETISVEGKNCSNSIKEPVHFRLSYIFVDSGGIGLGIAVEEVQRVREF